MKKYKMTDLLKKDEKSLSEDMAKLSSQLTDIKIKATTRKMSDDSSEAKKIKKQIARTQTALNSQKTQSSKKVEEK